MLTCYRWARQGGLRPIQAPMTAVLIVKALLGARHCVVNAQGALRLLLRSTKGEFWSKLTPTCVVIEACSVAVFYHELLYNAAYLCLQQ